MAWDLIRGTKIMIEESQSRAETSPNENPQEDLSKLEPRVLLRTYVDALKFRDKSLSRLDVQALHEEILRRLKLLDTLTLEWVPKVALHLAQGTEIRTRLLSLTKIDHYARIQPDTTAITSDL